MKAVYTYVGFLTIILLNACAEGDKKAEVTNATNGPNVIIDSTGLKGNSIAGNNTVALNTNQPAVNQTLVNTQQQLTTSPQQGVTTTPQTVKISSEQMQQMQQQALQAQQKQQVQITQPPQQVQTTQQNAHPQFSTQEFTKMQDEAKKRGVQLNPAHGQPNHRCDIYVGQPMDSKPVAGLGPQQTPTAAPIQAAPQTVSVAPQPVKTAPGMNPSHGEPGHRCDIAVGAALNSKPVTPAVQTISPPVSNSKADSARGGK